MAVRRSHGFTRYVLSVQYHGAPFLGFSHQGPSGENCILPDGTDLRGLFSVEGRIRHALSALVGYDNHENFQVSSRTDRGVHALRNTCHVDIRPRRRRERGRHCHGDADDHNNCSEEGETMKEYMLSSQIGIPSKEEEGYASENETKESNSWDPLSIKRGLNYFLSHHTHRTEERLCEWNYRRQKRPNKTLPPLTSYWRSHRHTGIPSNDLRVLSVARAPSDMRNKFYKTPDNPNEPEYIDWNARFSATHRTYMYRILSMTNDERDLCVPFEWDRSWRIVQKELDVHAMKEGIKYFLGTHDFTSFRSKMCQRPSPVVTVNDVKVMSRPYNDPAMFIFGNPHEDFMSGGCIDEFSGMGNMTGTSSLTSNDGKAAVNLITIIVRGESFLYRQVRNMVGCLVAVGRGEIRPRDIKTILEKRDRRVAPAMAPAHGLFLVKVEHGDFVF